MGKTIYITILSWAAAIALSSCSSEQKQLDQRLADTPAVSSQSQLLSKSTQLIQNNENLTAEQKSQLLDLRSTSKAKMDELQKESLKLRSLLISEVFSTKSKTRDIDLVKGRIQKLEGQRTAVLFDSVDKANTIIGRSNFEQKPFFIESILTYDAQRGEY